MGELTVIARQEQLEQVQSFVEEHIESRFSPRVIQHVLLAVEEVFTNIARYAYPQGDGNATIICDIEQSGVRLTFIDEGIPYNPLSQSKPDITLNAEDRPIGGLGVYLARELMDSMYYRHECGRNVLCMEKQFTNRS